MASRLLALSGGDHTTLEDWEAWVTNPANFGASANWDDPTNGGEQILRVADQQIIFTSLQALDLDALVTATNYKVTIRPNYEGGVTSVGAKVAADGIFDAGTVDKTPRLVNSGYNHQFVLDISNTSTVEWYIEGLTIRPAHHRSGSIAFPANPTRNIYVDRCIVADRTPGGASVFIGGPQPTAVGRVYVRSCLLDSSDDVAMLWNNASGVFLLGNTIRVGTPVSPFIHRSGGGQLLVHVYGNAIYYVIDGSTAFEGTNMWVPSDFVTGYNVANMSGASWTSDFSGVGNVSNSTIAGMFVSATNQYPKAGGALADAVTWSGLPPSIQAAWPDFDFFGVAIAKSGTFSAGAIYLAPSLPARVAVSAIIYTMTGEAGGTATIAAGSSATYGLDSAAAGAVAVAGASEWTLAAVGQAAGAVALDAGSAAALAYAGVTAGGMLIAGSSVALLEATGATAGALAVAAVSSLTWTIAGAMAGQNPYLLTLPPGERHYSVTLQARSYSATLAARAYTVTLPPRSYS